MDTMRERFASVAADLLDADPRSRWCWPTSARTRSRGSPAPS